MPLVLEGFDRTLYLLDQFEIELSLAMNQKIARAMQPIATKARGFIPNAIPVGLSGWAKPPVTTVAGWRDFPIFNSAEMKAGIQYRPGLQKQTRRGFAKAYAVTNESAAGFIYETAGRKHPQGTPNKSRSGVKDWNGVFHPNPKAGEHFINALGPVSRASRKPGQKGRSKKNANGRAIFRAWNEDQGNVIAAVNSALREATKSFNAKHTIFKIAA